MVSFLRGGDFNSRVALRFLAEFRKSKIDQVALRPEAYHCMLEALLTCDNLPFITVSEIHLTA